MSNGYRILGIATLAAALLIAFGIGAYWMGLPYPQERYQPYQNSAKVEKGAAATVSNVAVTIVEHTPCNKPKSEGESELCAQWRATKAAEKSADWALYGVIASAIGISLLLWQIMLTREAVKDTGDATAAMKRQNDLAHAAQRAWVAVDLKPIFIHQILPHDWKGPDENPSEIRISANVTLKNIGHTSAEIEALYFFCLPVGTMPAENIESMARSEMNLVHHIPNAIIPTGEIEIDVLSGFPFNWVEGSGHRFNVIAVVEVVYSVGYTRSTFRLSPAGGESDTAFRRFISARADGIVCKPYRYQQYD